MKISFLRAKRLAIAALLRAEKRRQQTREAEAKSYDDQCKPLKGMVNMKITEYFVSQQVLVDILLDEIELVGQKETAQEYGISPQYLNDVIRGRRTVGEKLARSLGFEVVRLFKSVPQQIKEYYV